MQIEISGIENGTGGTNCTNCDELNGTYIVPAGVEQSTYCGWYTTLGEWVCNQDPWERITSIWLWIQKSDGSAFWPFGEGTPSITIPENNYWLLLTLNSDFDWPHYGYWIVYLSDLGSDKPDCNFSNQEIPFFGAYDNPSWFHYLGCDPSSSVAKITAH
jgi:hypothetical protein